MFAVITKLAQTLSELWAVWYWSLCGVLLTSGTKVFFLRCFQLMLDRAEGSGAKLTIKLDNLSGWAAVRCSLQFLS